MILLLYIVIMVYNMSPHIYIYIYTHICTWSNIHGICMYVYIKYYNSNIWL